MKGLPGIIIAAALGIVGAFCNWFYINNEARNYKKVEFIAISDDADINVGDRFREEHFVRVGVPASSVGNLIKSGVLHRDIATAIGKRAIKSYQGGEILLQSHLTGIAQQDLTERLGKNEVLFQVVVDAATFIPEHYNPGDEVEFFVPQMLNTATPAGTSQGNGAGSTNTVGKFRILALGGRKGKRETATAYNQRPVRENIVTIALTFPFDSQAEELFRLITTGGGRGVRMIKHKPTKSNSK